jgi:membrane-associated protease RseP (regulator of RpoE activity)
MSALSIVIAILGLALLIVLHEGGHFLVARLCGMRVERF